MESKLYVGNLPYSATEDSLRTLFAQAGTVKSTTVITDRETGRSKGFGFVEMTTAAEAQAAITMFDGYQLNERALKVNVARPREESGGYGRSGGGGGGYGRGGGGGGGGGGGYGREGGSSRGGSRGGGQRRNSW